MGRTDFWEGDKRISEMTASRLMERDVTAFGTDGSCHDIANIMAEKHFDDTPIVDGERRPIGVVTEIDLLTALMSGYDLKTLTAADVMSRQPFSIFEEMKGSDIIDLLRERRVIRVPVVDSNGRLVGIVSKKDLLAGHIEWRFRLFPIF